MLLLSLLMVVLMLLLWSLTPKAGRRTTSSQGMLDPPTKQHAQQYVIAQQGVVKAWSQGAKNETQNKTKAVRHV